MKNLIQENGFLKSSLFIGVVFCSFIPPIAYAVFWLLRYLENSVSFKDISILLILCWIFFSTKSEDFFGEGKTTSFQPRHVVMLCALLFSLLSLGERSFLFQLMAFFGLSVLLTGKNQAQGLYWKRDFSIPNINLKEIEQILKKELFIKKIVKADNTLLVEGYKLFLLKITIHAQNSQAQIQVEPMNTGLSFCFALKLSPVSIGYIFGEDILKKITMQNTELINAERMI